MHVELRAPFLHSGAGIYAIINALTGKIYIGSALRINTRWNCHRSELASGDHGNRYLLRAFRKEPSAFQLQLVEELNSPTKDILLAREQFWIDFYESANPTKGYNIAPKAKSCQGIKRDPGYVARVSKSLTGFKHSDQARANMRAAQARIKRHPRSAISKLRMQWAHLGLKPSDSAIAKAALHNRDNRIGYKPVLQFTMDGEFVSGFASIAEAENKFGRRSNIHSVCKGKREHCFGFLWRYAHAS